MVVKAARGLAAGKESLVSPANKRDPLFTGTLLSLYIKHLHSILHNVADFRAAKVGVNLTWRISKQHYIGNRYSCLPMC